MGSCKLLDPNNEKLTHYEVICLVLSSRCKDEEIQNDSLNETACLLDICNSKILFDKDSIMNEICSVLTKSILFLSPCNGVDILSSCLKCS